MLVSQAREIAMIAKRRISTREVIATAVGYDMAEIEDYRYQSTRTPTAVYAIGDYYYCAPTKAQKLPSGWKWTAKGTFLGRDVYAADTSICD
jgi:hypothetical protein